MTARTAYAGRGLLAGGAFAPGRWFAELHQAWTRFKSYRDTLAELDAMSDRDLADIGISRLSIREIAREAVYGK